MNGAHRPAVLVEAFSDQPFAGNGAAVVHLEQAMPLAWLQSVATSLRQSETAFVLRASEGWMLRWCTPTCEVPLCGHATLAALLALGHWGLVEPGDSLVFHSRSGPLEASLPSGSAGSGAIVLPSAQIGRAHV